MMGDFTRTTFDAALRFSRVLMQQGRVTIDADANEQTDILLHYLRTLAVDLIGPCAGPVSGGGFALGTDANGQLTIGAGRYYVDGILVENDQPCLYSTEARLSRGAGPRHRARDIRAPRPIRAPPGRRASCRSGMSHPGFIL